MHDDMQQTDQLNGVFSSIARTSPTCASRAYQRDTRPARHGCRNTNEMVANSFTVLNVY